MKKFNLFLLAFLAFAVSSKAVEWPSTYKATSATGCWFGTPNLASEADREAALRATAEYLGETFTLPDAGDSDGFDNIYDGIENEYNLEQLRDGTTALDNDGVAAYKAGYDSEAIYIFLTYSHKNGSTLNWDFNTEVMFSPYDQLEYTGSELLESENPLWIRYLELGGVKFAYPNVSHTFALTKYMGATNDDPGFMHLEENVAGSIYEDKASVVDCSAPDHMRTILKVKFSALDNRLEEKPFTVNTWKEACEGKGISFEVKITLDNSISDKKRSYMWNSKYNDSFYSNSYAGYLAFAATYNVTVAGGIADLSNAGKGETVTITANVPDGKTFIHWESEDGVVFADATAAVTTFEMPEKDVTVTAVYWNIGVEEGNVEEIALYPNPATGYITLKGITEGAYTIANAAGATISSGIYQGNAIDISSFSQGLYFISIGNNTMPFVKK